MLHKLCSITYAQFVKWENSVVPFWLIFQFRAIEIIRLSNIMGSMSDLQNFN